jgi:hypothetical protein
LDELTKDADDDNELTVTKSHEQSLLEFKRNDDKVRTVVREIEATNVDSENNKKRHMLSFRNYQPEVLPQLAEDLKTVMANKESGKQCMFVQVTIKIVTTRVSKTDMYNKELLASDHPMLVKCSPDESPIFVHGREQSIEFSAIFNSKPYLTTTHKEATEEELRLLTSIKYEMINIKDGVKSSGSVYATKVVLSMKSGLYKPKLTLSSHFDLTEV